LAHRPPEGPDRGEPRDCSSLPRKKRQSKRVIVGPPCRMARDPGPAALLHHQIEIRLRIKPPSNLLHAENIGDRRPWETGNLHFLGQAGEHLHLNFIDALGDVISRRRSPPTCGPPLRQIMTKNAVPDLGLAPSLE